MFCLPALSLSGGFALSLCQGSQLWVFRCCFDHVLELSLSLQAQAKGPVGQTPSLKPPPTPLENQKRNITFRNLRSINPSSLSTHLSEASQTSL